MAPEQVEGGDVDAPADEYALACVAFQCLTGRVPFVRDSDVAVAMAHLHDAPPSAVTLRSELPAGVDAVLARGMAKDREARYPTCVAFVTDLRKVLGGRLVVKGAAGSRPSRSRPLAVAAMVGVGILAVVGLGLASGLFGRVSSSPSPAGSGSTAASSSATPPDATTFPNSNEAELIAALPDDLQDVCVRGSMADVSGPRGASGPPNASVTCTQGNIAFQAKRLDPSIVHPGEALTLRATERLVPPGNCEIAAPAIGTWKQGSREIGSVACYQDGISSVIEWTYEDEGLLVRAAFPYVDAKSVASWWLDTRDLIGRQRGSRRPSRTRPKQPS